MTRARFLEHIRTVLTEAVLAGAARILQVRREAMTTLRYKALGELVTLADERSDAAMSEVFERHLPRLAPAVGWHLEESGLRGAGDEPRRVGGDPLDGTQHFASGGNLYCVQAHYLERGVPLVGVIFQPEVYLPVAVRPGGVGRLTWAIRGGGAYVQRSEYRQRSFGLGRSRGIPARPRRTARALTACVPISVKMLPAERQRATRVLTNALVGATVGAGSAGANILMVVFGGQDVYASFGAGNELDIAPGQVIAQEVGLAVRTRRRRAPVWDVWKQPVVVAPSARIADRVLRIAGIGRA